MKNKEVILEEFRVYITDLYDKYVLLIDNLIEENKIDLIVNCRNDFEKDLNLKLESYNLIIQENAHTVNGNGFNSIDAIIRLNLEKIIISERIKLEEYIETRLGL
jgi:hypothetical protein